MSRRSQRSSVEPPCSRSQVVVKRALKSLQKFVLELWEDELICISIFRKLFFIQGFWPTQETEMFPGYLIRYINAHCVVLCALYVALISSPIAAFLSEGRELIDTLEPIALTFITLMITFYAGSFLFLGDRFKNLLTALDEMKHRGSFHAQQPTNIIRRTKILTALTLGYFGECVFNTLVFVFGLIPQLVEKRRFYTSGWYPYDSTASPFYEITLVGWVASLISGSCLIALVNGFLMANFVQAIGQFQLLNHNLKAMHTPGEKPKENSKETIDDIKTSDTNEEKHLEIPSDLSVPDQIFPGLKYLAKQGNVWLDKTKEMQQRRKKKEARKRFGEFFQSTDVQMKIVIDRCARHHQAILSYVGCINSAFNLILIQQYSCSIFPSLIAIILITHSTELNMKIALITILVMVCNLTLALYCFLAYKITEESELVRHSIFSSDWLAASDNFKRSMRVMMCRSNQPAVVRVGGFITVSRESYLSVVKLIYSYYMAARATIKHMHR